MDPREFQRLSKELVRRTSSAEIRTAISRSYYAAFHVGASFLTQLGRPISEGPKAHQELREYLAMSGDADIKQIGIQFADLQNRRIRADYRLNDTRVEDSNEARLWVIAVDQIIQRFENCLADRARSTSIRQSLRLKKTSL